jgi:mannose-6-phosphate isomerase-like protein (cupin superfamily)
MRHHPVRPILLAAAITLAIGTLLVAQAPAVVYKRGTELTGVLVEKAKATPAPQMVAAPVSTGEGYQINVVRRTTSQGAIAHDVGSEIHSIIDGAATLVTGGTLNRPAGGRGGGGTIEGGESRRVSKGDVVLVPPQTPHWYKDIDGMVTYLEIRFDVGAAPGGPATAITSADVAKTLTTRGAASPAPLMFSAPVARGDRFQANVVRRTKAQGGGAHELGTEVHHILEGSGTLVTSGTVVRPGGAGGMATIQGGDSHHVVPGDVVLVPAGTPHWYKDVDGTITYLEVRFEVGAHK